MDDEAFLEELRQLVATRASAMNLVDTLAFVEEIAERLSEDPVFGDFERIEYAGMGVRNRQLKLHGATALDPSDGTLGLIIGRWSDLEVPSNLPSRDVEQLTAFLLNFIEEAMGSDLASRIVEANPAYEIARTLGDEGPAVSRIRLHVFSNQNLSQRFREESLPQVRGIPVERHIWDLRRIKDIYLSAREREELEITFGNFGRDGIPCLLAAESGKTTSYVCTVDGALLADLFEKYGGRLLEGNVRAFLGIKGGVNKGIRATIQDSPGLFFAYNNGIAATASEIEVVVRQGMSMIRRVVDLQIVNGGQTTAAILSARKKDKLSLAGVTVPMKLTKVEPAESHELIPKIAQYANTQNKVDIADFFSNHPFHRKMADISIRLRVPAKAGVRVQSKWYYERSRGQYQNERLYLTKAQKEQRDLEFPPAQVINKTDLAKYDSTWQEKPYWACLGVQKNIRNFAKVFEPRSADVSESEYWDQISPNYADGYYRRIVSMAILWKAGERLVSGARETWYRGDYRAQIVAYSLALLVSASRIDGGEFDVEKLWRAQEADAELLRVVEKAAQIAQDVIVSPPAGITNYGEWAKKEACWTAASKRSTELRRGIAHWLVGHEEANSVVRANRQDGRQDGDIAIQKEVLALNLSGYWTALLKWERFADFISGPDLRLVTRAASKNTCLRISTPKEWRRLMEIATKSREEGFRVQQRKAARAG
jgi:hypothetical protein